MTTFEQFLKETFPDQKSKTLNYLKFQRYMREDKESSYQTYVGIIRDFNSSKTTEEMIEASFRMISFATALLVLNLE